jgi:hypothetical protein
MLVYEIARETGFSPQTIAAIAHSAHHRYKTYLVPKRGSEGKRVIAHPAKELKALQLWISNRLLANVPIHDTVFSYRQGRGIRDNAEAHRKNNFLLRLDLTDFFPSIKRDDVRRFLVSVSDSLPFQLNDDDRTVVALLAARKTGLAIGAPSSPAISNAILFPFDEEWSNRAADQVVTYTRYADDLYFSTNSPNILEKIPLQVATTLRHLPWPRLSLNVDKTIFTSRKRERRVTGLVLTSRNEISIGRDRKRFIRSLVYRFTSGGLAADELSYLRGFLAFVNGVEPSFLATLERKFGGDVIHTILRSPVTPRKPESR